MDGNKTKTKNKNYILFWLTPGAQPGVRCRQGSLDVVLLTCYAGPTVGAGVVSVLPVGQKYIRCKRSIWGVQVASVES